MAKAEIKEKVPVSKEKFINTILNFSTYPEYVEGCVKTEILNQTENEAKVTFHVSMMKDLVYTLDHKIDRASGKITWQLVNGDAFKKNQGTWKIVEAGPNACEAHYEIEIDFAIPVPSFILSRMIKGSLPNMIKNFINQAKKS